MGELVEYLARSSRLTPRRSRAAGQRSLAFIDETARTSSAAATSPCKRKACRTARSSRRSPPSWPAPLSRARLQRAADPAESFTDDDSKRGASQCMCGIVGYIGKRDAAPILMEGLHRLEYRGYDSAGIACARNDKLSIFKSKGKVRDLERQLPEQ